MGSLGAFHHIAALRYFGSTRIEVLERPAFDAVIASVESGEARFGMLALENNLAGPISSNYPRLADSSLKMMGQVPLQLQLHLCARPGVKLEQLEEVHSHPVALKECNLFLDRYHRIAQKEGSDTASCARMVSELDNAWAAICSEEAARLYGLHVLVRQVDNEPVNITRFAVLGRDGEELHDSAEPSELIRMAVLGSTEKLLPGLLDHSSFSVEFEHRGAAMTYCEIEAEQSTELEEIFRAHKLSDPDLRSMGLFRPMKLQQA